MKKKKYNYIDAHSHAVDFLQEPKGLKQTLYWMDKANISHSVIFGLPLIKNKKEYDYYYQTDEILAKEYLILNNKEQKRFFPLICGFNPTDKMAIKRIEKIISKFPNIWHGFGEILFRHDKISREIEGEHPRINHSAMDDIYQFCAEKNMPILIHQNLNSENSSPNPEAMQELEQTLDKHKKTIFVLSHAGSTPKIYNPNQPEIIRELLSYHQNLFIDLSWKIQDKFIYRAAQLDENWVELSQDFSDRICLGSDNTENPQEIPEILAKFDILLDSIDKKAQKNLAFRTARKLYYKVKA